MFTETQGLSQLVAYSLWHNSILTCARNCPSLCGSVVLSSSAATSLAPHLEKVLLMMLRPVLLTVTFAIPKKLPSNTLCSILQ